MIYDPDRKALVCPQCGREQGKMPENGSSGRNECPNCGAAFEKADRRLVYQCPYCSSWMTVENNLESPDAPARIIPFSFGKKKARGKIQDAFDNIPFLPDSFLKDPEGNDIEALYAPFWVYDADARGEYLYNGEKQRTVAHGDTRTTHHSVYKIIRNVRARYDSIMVDAMDSLDNETIDAALPYNPELQQSMDPVYLSGTAAFLPDKSSQDAEYISRAQDRVETSMSLRENNLVSGYSTLHQERRQVNVYPVLSRDGGVLLPVYRYNYKSLGNHKIYMNGTTGRMSGDAPCDKGKVFLHYILEAVCTVVSAAAIVGILGVLL